MDTVTFTKAQIDTLAASIESTERNRIYRGVKRLYDATSDETGHGRAKRTAYREVLGVIAARQEQG